MEEKMINESVDVCSSEFNCDNCPMKQLCI